MAMLKIALEELGLEGVTTYIQSGNVIVQSNLSAEEIKHKVETLLPQKFQLDSSIIKVLVLSHEQLKAVVDNKPTGFGEKPDVYHSDAIFLMGIDENEALGVFSPKEGIDAIWPGTGVIYSQRLSSERTKSRLNRIIGTPAYASMTIRNWNTTTKLLALLDGIKSL